MGGMIRAAILTGVLLAAGCGYEPPAQANRTSSAYKTDLAACDDTVPHQVNQQNAKTGLRWFASPVRRWSQISDGVQSCMAGKGYGRTRSCTDEEIRQGGRDGSLVATAAGLRCTDAPDARHRGP